MHLVRGTTNARDTELFVWGLVGLFLLLVLLGILKGACDHSAESVAVDNAGGKICS